MNHAPLVNCVPAQGPHPFAVYLRWRGHQPAACFALDVTLGDLGPISKLGVLAAIRGHILGEAELIGTYERKRR